MDRCEMNRGRVIDLIDAPKDARIIVCGGVDFVDHARLFSALDALRPRELAQGGAAGADSLAEMWAIDRGVPSRTYAASWRFGKMGGHARNKHMFDDFKPDGVLAAPGNAGTRNMILVALDGGAWVIHLPNSEPK